MKLSRSSPFVDALSIFIFMTVSIFYLSHKMVPTENISSILLGFFIGVPQMILHNRKRPDGLTALQKYNYGLQLFKSKTCWVVSASIIISHILLILFVGEPYVGLWQFLIDQNNNLLMAVMSQLA